MAIIDDARASLQRVQNADVAKIVRREELGADLNFSEAEAPARRVIDLFLQIPPDHLTSLPDGNLQQVRDASDAFFSILDQAFKFKSNMDNATAQHTSIVSQITNSYNNTFSQLHPIISYISSRQKDYSALERDARAKIQQASDRADELAKVLAGHEDDAKRVLEEIKKVAAEQGVSQQAVYFKTESESHTTQAETWQKRIIILAGVLVLYAAASVFLHKWPLLAPATPYEAIQLAISKTLIFAVIAYLLFLSARSFLSHQHNAIVNKHRQNALLTFKSLADAAGTKENRDIVLTHAAACIFSPQETGYTKGGQQPGIGGVIESLPRVMQSTQSLN